MKNEKTAKRLAIALSSANMKPQELSDRSGVSKSSISQYINGSHSPSNISSGKIAKILDVNPLWLMGFDVEMKNFKTESVPVSGGVNIPVLGRVAAGIPINAIQEILDYEEIPADLASRGDFFALQIKGDSMEPRICEGDVVIVEQQSDAESGDLVIAMVNGDDATCKRLKKYAGGLMLIANNPKYEPMVFSDEDIQNKPVSIVGKVVELRGKF